MCGYLEMAVSESERLCEVEFIRCVKSEMLNRKAAAFCAVAFLRQMKGGTDADRRMQIEPFFLLAFSAK